MTGIEQVPMPNRIALLPRDGRGFPVPFVADWQSERDDGEPPCVKRAVLLPGVDWFGFIPTEGDIVGTGRPMLGRVNPGRAIRAHEHSICNVCGTLIGKRLVFVGGEKPNEQSVQCYTEAPLHRECARYALQVCPGLVTAVARDSTLIVTEIEHEQVEYAGKFLVVGRGDERMVNCTFDEATATANFRPLVLMAVVAAVETHGRMYDSKFWLRERGL